MKHIKKVRKPKNVSGNKTRETLAREGKSAANGCPERSWV